MNPTIRGLYAAELGQLALDRASVLEVGAMGRCDLDILGLVPSSCTRIGVNSACGISSSEYPILHGSGNDMHMIESCSIDIVLCNAVLEHDLRFWKTIREIQRVLKHGGNLLLGVPGVGESPTGWALAARALYRKWKRHPNASARAFALWVQRFDSSRVLSFHSAPSDYYRFTRVAVSSLLQDGFRVQKCVEILEPPRVFAVAERV